MYFRDSIIAALQMIARNKTQSFLTMLGIVIGIMSVIIVMSLGASAQEFILGQIKNYGSNMIAILPGKPDDSGAPASAFGIVATSLKNKDAESIINANNPHIDGVSMYVRGSDIITWEENSVSTTFYGTTASYPEIENSIIEKGKFFSKDEELSNATVVVLGGKIANELFGEDNPLGQKIKIRKSNFTIVGVLKTKGGNFIQNQDEEIFVPIKTAQNVLLGINYLDFMRMRIDKTENIDKVKDDVVEILRTNHSIDSPEDDDFTVRSVAQALEAISSITDILKFFLVAVSAISLIVGGFGIMNIMLAIVQERVKEIGLRKALGATSNDIVWQFLVEAVTITFISGIIGIVLGVSISFLAAQIITALGYTWPFIISYDGIALGCLVSICIGLVFGIVPALRASKLDPIEALRYE
ncbi:MAG: ABC transporter permease [Candidatus Paceibacterota bacterium]|jgi:putative ABC transport system permease protein|nr:ABC transporter permease [bacterium]